MNPHPTTRAFRISQAFTRTDLLALIAVIGLLGLVILPALARTTRESIVAQCTTNLRRYYGALQVYGDENQDALPSSGNAGNWPRDVGLALAIMLTNNGANVASLYCPGNYDFTNESSLITAFMDWTPVGYCALGYVATLPNSVGFGVVAGSYQFGTNINTNFSVQRPTYNGYRYPVVPAKRTLIADMTLTDHTNSLPAPGPALLAAESTYRWAGTFDEFPFSSAHLVGNLPLGGNVATLDGHVQWQPFANMIPRAGAGVIPTFFW